MRGERLHTMHGNSRKGITSLLALILSALVALIGCSQSLGHSKRSMMSVEEASADCLKEVSSLIQNSDTDSFLAAFSEKARSEDPELAAKAEKVISLMGGGTMSEEDFYMSVGSISSGAIYVVSSATVTASDGTKWQIHITDCTYNKEDPSQVGLKLIEIIPYSDWDAPKGFGWYSEASGQSHFGIRLITSWEGWDHYTSPYTW